MIKERLGELDEIATLAIAECHLVGQKADDVSLAYWRGVKSVVDELKAKIKAKDDDFSAHDMVN